MAEYMSVGVALVEWLAVEVDEPRIVGDDPNAVRLDLGTGWANTNECGGGSERHVRGGGSSERAGRGLRVRVRGSGYESGS